MPRIGYIIGGNTDKTGLQRLAWLFKYSPPKAGIE